MSTYRLGAIRKVKETKKKATAAGTKRDRPDRQDPRGSMNSLVSEAAMVRIGSPLRQTEVNKYDERPRPPKLPPFARQNVKLWFSQCEALFRTARMFDDEDRFSCVIGTLEMDVAEQVHHLIVNPPDNNKYETFKAELIFKFSDTLSERQEKLSRLVLGTSKPSFLLTQMQAVGHDLVSEDYLRNLWLKRLPDPVRTVLAAAPDPLQILARKADELVSLSENSGEVCSVRRDKMTDTEHLENQIAILRDQIAALKTQARPTQEHNNSDRAGWCSFHRKYQNKAYRCVAPCTFQKNF
ncbi:hypothetical protein GE061_018919 [Apolygus lucorum]|uniref:DUF7041 domain-containing protein n=1 Tax=Apolygus lucorum TaxID=248454 RepID=A0A8S9X6Z5_APOLU|nr:hypothetical protein GE061_018919 [Apolygus lucorum]